MSYSDLPEPIRHARNIHADWVPDFVSTPREQLCVDCWPGPCDCEPYG